MGGAISRDLDGRMDQIIWVRQSGAVRENACDGRRAARRRDVGRSGVWLHSCMRPCAIETAGGSYGGMIRPPRARSVRNVEVVRARPCMHLHAFLAVGTYPCGARFEAARQRGVDGPVGTSHTVDARRAAKAQRRVGGDHYVSTRTAAPSKYR